MVKKSANNPEYSRDREFLVILEDLRSQFRVFGEGQQLLIKRMGALENRVGTLENRFDSLEITVHSMKVSMDRFFVIINDHEKRIKTLETAG